MYQAVTREDRAGNAYVTTTCLNKRKKCGTHDSYAYWLEDILKTCTIFHFTFIFACYLEVSLHKRQEGTMQLYFKVKNRSRDK